MAAIIVAAGAISPAVSSTGGVSLALRHAGRRSCQENPPPRRGVPLPLAKATSINAISAARGEGEAPWDRDEASSPRRKARPADPRGERA